MVRVDGSSLALGLARGLLLHDVLVQSVNDGHRQQDTRAGTDGSQEISENGQQTSKDTSEQGCSFDNVFQLLVGAFISVALNRHALFLQAVCDLAGALTRDGNPGFTEEGTA